MSASSRLLEDVSDTALWVAFHRALESERPDALFRDPFARELAGERGKSIAEGMPPVPLAHRGTRGLSWGLAVRTKVFDELILGCIAAVNADAVLNLAAGLDARPYRLPLSRSLVWIEVDRAPLLESKARVLGRAKPVCVLERVPIELADPTARRNLFERLAAQYQRIVVVTEGLLVYLDEPLVASLASELRERHSMQRWILETISPATLKNQMRAWRSVLAAAHAEWHFAPKNGFDFFRTYGWARVSAHSCVVEARRLGREEMRFAKLYRVLSSLSSGFRQQLEGAVQYGVLQPVRD